MEIEYQLYHLYVHSIFVSNIESSLRMNKHIYCNYNKHLLRLYESNQGDVCNLSKFCSFTLIPDGTIDHHACKWIDHGIK
jgi:hypothetical protein